LGEPGEEAAATRRRLERSGVDLASARAVRVFGAGSPAGSTAEFVATRDGTLVVAAPGPVMDFDRQDTATPVELLIRRATPRSAGEEPLLPEPLADPLIDLRVRRMTAQAYLVQGWRVHSGHRRGRPPVHRLPVLLRPQARQGQ
jgi:aminomethyltransferase